MNSTTKKHIGDSITITWGTSRGRDSYGYTTCSLRDSKGKRIAYCNGGGYDMCGTVIGNWLAHTFSEKLRALKQSDMPKQSHYNHDKKETVNDGRYFYGLCFVDPNYDVLNAKLEHSDGTFTTKEDEGKTFRELKDAGKIVDLDILRTAYKETSKHATKRHTIPHIDGACGVSSVLQILNAIGLSLNKVCDKKNLDVYVIEEYKKQ